jgi:phenylacetate-coenzyme A ligase PaaK-like adenylate-forming protein
VAVCRGAGDASPDAPAGLLSRATAAPYYRAVLRDAGIRDVRKLQRDEFERLPFLDRQVIAHHGLEAFLTVNESRLFAVTTSGSTGTPGRFLRSSLEEAEFSARWRRVYAAWGCSAFDPRCR